MKKNLLRTLDLLFLMRPILLVPVWGFSLFGYYRAKTESLKEITSLWNSSSLPVCFLFFSPSVGAVYIFNQIATSVDKK